MPRVRRTAIGLALAGTVLSAQTAPVGAAGLHDHPAPRASVRDGVDPGPGDVRDASLAQTGPDLVWEVRTRGPWASESLRGGAGRRICLSVSRNGAEVRRACVVRRGGGLALRSTPVGADGRPTGWRATDAVVSRPTRRVLRVTGPPTALVGRTRGAVRWFVTTAWEGGPRCLGTAPCSDRAPRRGAVGYRVRTAVPAGCEASGPTLRVRGPEASHEVALTFDDGPWTLTSRFLDELRRLGVPATFFMIGRQVASQAPLLRRMVREGHAIGNHTWDHAPVAGGGAGEVASTNDAIRRAVGFAPCLFRPPGGARGPVLDGQLASAGMLDVLWTVDTDDWKLPGTAAVADRAGSAPAGAIVLMHDGGGPRDATLAALPTVVARLRARGLTPVTVPQLLGLRSRWRYR